MSEVYTPEAEDIDVDHDSQEVTFFVKSDDNGNIYLCLNFEQIAKIAKECAHER